MKDNKGITLIALVITIIVMLILVAVTITMAVNGGLFGYAGNAAKQTNEEMAKESELINIPANMTTDELIDKFTGVVRYGLRADGRFYCNPESTTGKYDSSRTRGYTTNQVFEPTNFRSESANDPRWPDDDVVYIVWEADDVNEWGVLRWDIFDANGNYIESQCQD